MPEIGLLPFDRVAMDVGTTVLPAYRSRFSKHQFTQPQLLAILCLMRYEDWTFREAEVRLREHAELLAAGAAPLDTVRLHYNPIVETIAGMPKPVVAALPGVAAGAGASLAFACDFRIAAERASLLLAFARVGLGADTGASWTLPRLIGSARAAEMLMLAESVDSVTALRLGLLTSVVPDDELPAAAAAFARKLAEGPTMAYAAIKESLMYASSHGLSESLEKEAELQVRLGDSTDHRAATTAFVNKQEPVYQGR